jgi:hypothetical protein
VKASPPEQFEPNSPSLNALPDKTLSLRSLTVDTEA